jgi:hypothetical protein
MAAIEQPAAVVIAGGLYAYGETEAAAWLDFQCRIQGASFGQRAYMMQRARLVRLSPDDASEVAECIAAPAVGWL